MDWYVEPGHPGAARQLRHELRAYLERHATPESDVDAAELAADELVTNALERASGPVWVSVEWSGTFPVLSVHDLGGGFELDPSLPDDLLSERGRGLYLVAHLVSGLSVAAKRAGGSKVSARLPVARPAEQSYDPPTASRMGALPAEDEVGADGTFSREPFLRALVVELARVLEHDQGPAASEAAVAQVGAEVGGRIEQAYRQARALAGRLDAEQLAELFVELKRAIEGDFYVIEADDDRIVLGNSRCPFGTAVQRAPALCRMTSSVFGGIAARNADVSAVVLEERIAVGDPECRVVVWLRPPPEEVEAVAHRYQRA